MTRKLQRIPRNPKDALVEGGTALRTLGMGLIAAAAIAASVMIGRTRQDRPVPGDPTLTPPAGDAAPPPLSLDAIRAAGL